MLIALAAKNAILIVAFAKQAEDERGVESHDAAVEAAGTRLRPILMTFLRLRIRRVAAGHRHRAGAEMRQALGTAVFFGMIGVTVFGLIFTPVFYVVSRAVAKRMPDIRKNRASPPAEAASHD